MDISDVKIWKFKLSKGKQPKLKKHIAKGEYSASN